MNVCNAPSTTRRRESPPMTMPSCESLDEGGGGDLAAGAGDGVGGDVVVVDGPVQRPDAGGGLFGGQVRDEVGHAVGGQPDPHVPPGSCGAGSVLGLVGGDLHGQAGGEVVDPAHPE